MSQITDEIRSKAEIYQGNSICQEKMKQLLKKMELPNGLLPIKEIEEFGYVESTGFAWIKQKNKMEYKFEKIGKLAQYATEITVYVEKKKAKKLTGAKVKELFLWITIAEATVDEPSPGKITIRTPQGLPKTFPVSAFEIDDEPKDKSGNGVSSSNKGVQVK